MIRKIILSCFILPASIASSQEVCSFTLFFPSDSHHLNQRSQLKIDSVIGTLSNIHKAYTIRISGHTDAMADLNYNNKLSMQRSSAVKEQFLKNHFSDKQISCKAYAFNEPAADNVSDKGKAKNRRVTVQIMAPTFDVSKAFNYTEPVKTCTIKATDGGKFKYSSGSEISIPPNAFETADGTIVTGDVKVKYTEYRSTSDFLKSGIPMSFFNESGELVQFNSGGMFNVAACQGDKQLKLKAQTDLKIKFARTQSLPDMEFFNYDTATGVWNKTDQLLSNKKGNTTSNAKSSATYNAFNPMSSWNNKYSEKIVYNEICMLHPCIGKAFATRKGVDLAFAPEPVNLDKPKIYFKEMYDANNRTRAYALKITSSTKTSVKFRIIPLDDVSPFDVFKDYQWVYSFNKKTKFKAQWENTVWLDLKLDYFLENDFSITLLNNAEKVKLKVKAAIRPKNMHNAQLYQMHYVNKDIYKANVLEQNRQLANFDLAVNEAIYNAGRKPLEFSSVCSDSLFCFYELSRQWMDTATGETKLSCKQWFDYFNTNKSLMKERYLKLQQINRTTSQDCYAAEIKKREETVKNARIRFVADSVNWSHQGEQYASLTTKFEELSITSLGIWNCDQVQRLQEPIYVKKQYKDEKGKKIEPIIVYVIDKKVSGALTYNGQGNLSPYYFPVSSKSENTLIAFDINNKGYVCKPEKIAKYIKEKDGSIIVLEPLNTAGTQVAVQLKH